MDKSKIKAFLQSTLKLSLAISLALVVTVAALVGGFVLYDNHQKESARRLAAPYEVVTRRTVDLKDVLSLTFTVETKLIDGEMYVSLKAEGYPTYLEHPENRSNGFLLQFLDRDGFRIYNKSIPLTAFTTIWGAENATGLAYQFKEYTGLESYRRFSTASIGWTVNPRLVLQRPQPTAPTPPASTIPDPCAPGLANEERLRRLARFGEVRQTSSNTYTAGARSLSFIGTQLGHCR